MIFHFLTRTISLGAHSSTSKGWTCSYKIVKWTLLFFRIISIGWPRERNFPEVPAIYSNTWWQETRGCNQQPTGKNKTFFLSLLKHTFGSNFFMNSHVILIHTLNFYYNCLVSLAFCLWTNYYLVQTQCSL